MSPPPDVDALLPPERKGSALELLAEREELRSTIGMLRDEIARLKRARPDIKPSGMEQANG